jgi:hypothetical protein
MKIVRNPIHVLLAAVFGIVVLGVVCLLLGYPPLPKTSPAAFLSADPNAVMPPTPFITPPINTPPTISASQATLKDDEEVIGVIVKGKPRAYRLSAFAGPFYHVVNDLLEGIPVSVTHCDQTKCTRVFTNEGKEPLALKLGGFDGSMLLYVDGQFYTQDNRHPTNPSAPPFPYDAVEFEQTTWGKWRAAHPTTDVYETAPNPIQNNIRPISDDK